MDRPATNYGQLDGRNPVVLGLKRDIKSFLALMKRVASVQDISSKAKGIKLLLEIKTKYKHRLPEKFYQEHILEVADFLCGIKLYRLALWHGYSPCLLQFSSVKITEITGVDHFMACFFPEGFSKDQHIFAIKIRAMFGCVLCIFEEEKSCSTLSRNGLCKLLRVLSFIRIMMQAFQQYEHLSWLIFKGSEHIYNICRYLMSVKHGEQALEYLLWASISLELSVSLMTANYLPLIITLYCAVCYCYYDNQAEVQAEEFAKRALKKLNELAKLEEHSDAAAIRATQRSYREASIKLGALMFKRAVFDNRRKALFKKTTFKDIPKGPWPRTQTEHLLISHFDCRAGQFLGILEALWDSSLRPLQMKVPDDAEAREVVLELLAAGMSILSGVTRTGGPKDPCLSPDVLTSASTLMDLAVTGEDNIPIMSAVRFVKLLFQYKQPDAFTELVQEILHFLSGVEGQPFRRAERELVLMHSFNNLLFPRRRLPKEDAMKEDKQKTSLLIGDELTGLVDTLHVSVCGSDAELQPDPDLVLDTVLFLWETLKGLILQTSKFTHNLKTMENHDRCVRCLSVLCEVALACQLEAVDCILMAEMVRVLGTHLERAAERFDPTQGSACKGRGDVKSSSFSVLERSSTELLKEVCEVVKKGLEALERGVSTLLVQDGSAVSDSAFFQKCMSSHPSSASSRLSEGETGEGEVSVKKGGEKDDEEESGVKGREQIEAVSRFLVAKDLHLELNIIHHKASLKLLLLNEVAESQLLDRLKKNKVSRAHFLMQKALLENSCAEPRESSTIRSLLEEASALIEKAETEERKLYRTTLKTGKTDGVPGKGESPPPPPVLTSRTGHSLTFTPAPYKLEGQVSWYQLCGRAAEGVDLKVRLSDFSIPGTGNMVPAASGDCVLRVEGLQPNQRYVFAVAAYNSQGKLLGKTIGGTTSPVLASMPVPLLPTWAHLAQVAFQTKQYAIAKKACRELWSHYTDTDCDGAQDRLAATGLHKPTLQHSSPHMCRLFLTSIFIETEISTQQESLFSLSDCGKVTWEQEARLAECERMLLAVDLAMCLNDGMTAVQAVVTCYRLLAPLMFHQISYDPVVQILKKCLVVLEENSFLLKHKWIGTTAESLTHMAASITYYLSKVLRLSRKHQMAAAVMDCGRNLLQEVYDAHLKISRLSIQTDGSKSVTRPAISGQKAMSLQLRALQRKTEPRLQSEPALETDDEPLRSCEDSVVLYELIHSSTLQRAYQKVMKLKHKRYFLEFVALLLQRTAEEKHPDLVLDWGGNMLQILSRRDENMRQSAKLFEEGGGSSQAPKENKKSQNQNVSSYDESRRKLKRKLPRSLLQVVRTEREVRMVENLLTMLSNLVRCSKKKIQLRNLCSEESVWRSYINCCMAQAHLALLYQGLDQYLKGPPRQRYSQFDPLWFSLAHTGVLMKRKSKPHQSPGHNSALEKDSSLTGGSDDGINPNKEQIKKEVKAGDPVSEKSLEEDISFQTVEQHMETQRYTSSSLLDSVQKAALYLRRAMVLAHRGNHWTTLQHVCHTAWDQSCRIRTAVQEAAQPGTPFLDAAVQLSATFTPLLVLAVDLIMDMMSKLELWRLYERDSSEKELESCLRLSAPVDDSTLVDQRWVRTLVFHTLELLHDDGRWERLAHFALLFNSYTRERYASIVAPLLLHAQSKLLERISSLGGPAVPQPHHVKTQRATGREVNYRSYAGCQLLSGWTPRSAQKQHPIYDKASRVNVTPGNPVSLRAAEMQLSMLLVCVPLDVENTTTCYRQALEKTPQSLQVLQRSRKLLVQLLAHTQPCFSTQSPHCQDLVSAPPRDPCEEDFSASDTIYGLPLSPDYTPTVTAAYSNSIKCLKANGHDSLRVLALHEMGNLQFYIGNMSAAHSCWSKAVDGAFQTAGVLEKWDGASFGCGSVQQTVEQAGVWGCLQAALITAKIAQFILTSDVSQRTKCCLLSAHLFKCVLRCSMAEPQTDLQYASHSVGVELLPGVDLFSDPHRLHIGTTVTSLNFICHWLYTTGYYITLLPVLSLYMHLVGHVCRDVRRTVEGKILKVLTLTELCLFGEAVTEAVRLTQGTDVILPNEHHLVRANLQPVKTFYSDKSLLDNLEALEDLVNCDFPTDSHMLYDPTLSVRFNLARAKLILALASSVHGRPSQERADNKAFPLLKWECLSDPGGTCANTTSCPVNSDHREQGSLSTEDPCPNTEKPKILNLCSEKEKLSPERIKFLLLEGASSLLSFATQQLTSHSCSETEKVELTIESNRIRANLYLQQGRGALSCKAAASSLELMQTSPVVTAESGLESKQDIKDCSVSDTLYQDFPRAAEAGERIGMCLWLRCRLALVQSLAANIPDTEALFPGINTNEETARVIQEGLDECVQCGECDIQALLMVEGAELDDRRGRKDDSRTKLQGAVSLLSGRTYMPPASVGTLARAVLLLSEQEGVRSSKLLKGTQRLLKKQLRVFGQSSTSVDGSSNIYLPYFDILNKITLQIGSNMNLAHTEGPVSALASQSNPKDESEPAEPGQERLSRNVPSEQSKQIQN